MSNAYPIKRTVEFTAFELEQLASLLAMVTNDPDWPEHYPGQQWVALNRVTSKIFAARGPRKGDQDGEDYRPDTRFSTVCLHQNECVRANGHEGKHVALDQPSGEIVRVW